MRGEAARELRESAKVRETDRPARTRQQTDERRPRLGIADDAQRRDDVDDLGGREESPEPQDPVRDAAPPERVAEAHHVLLAAEQHGTGRGAPLRSAGRAHPREPGGDTVCFAVQVTLEERFHDSCGGARARAELFDGDRRAARQRGQDGVRRRQHARAVAPARQQRKGLASPGRGERVGEAAQIAGTRSAPRVDGLVGVTDRHDSRPREQGREQIGLHDGGVLILVEQDDAVARPEFLDHGRVFPHDPQGSGDLVGEVHDAQSRLLSVVRSREFGQQPQSGDPGCRVRDVLVDGHARGGGRAFHDAPEFGGERREPLEIDEVVQAVSRDAERRIDECARGLLPFLQPRVVRREDDPSHEKPRRGLRQHGRLGIPADAEPVLAHDRVREAVVGGHRGAVEQLIVVVPGVAVDPTLLGEGVQHSPPLGIAPRALDPCELGEDVQTALGMQGGQSRQQTPRLEFRQAMEAPVDTFGQLARGLPRERQTQHLVATDEPVRHEPHDASRHGLGLAAPRAGDDERR